MGLSGAEPLQYCRQYRQYCERSAEDSPTPSPTSNKREDATSVVPLDLYDASTENRKPG